METTFVQRARDFALKAHGEQTYAATFPYFSHLEGVVEVLTEFGHTDDVFLASGYLHDTLEDTRTSYSDLEKEFGREVADIVYDVTDELGKNRKHRHVKTYFKTKENKKAVVVKLADRLANVKFSAHSGGDKLNMYKKEHGYFKAVLFDGQNLEMWAKLDELLG